jgi:hypothetical protein
MQGTQDAGSACSANTGRALIRTAWINGLWSFVTREADGELQTTALEIDNGMITAAHDTLCNENGCLARVGNAAKDILEADSNHFSATGSRYLVSRIANQCFSLNFPFANCLVIGETARSVFIDFIGAPMGFEPVSQPVIGIHTFKHPYRRWTRKSPSKARIQRTRYRHARI